MFWIGQKVLCGVSTTAVLGQSKVNKKQVESTPVINSTRHETFSWINVRYQKNTGDMAYPKRFSQLQLSRTGFRGSDKVRNREILGRLRGSFTAPKLKISYNASQRFCFASVISLNDVNDLRVIEARSLKCRILASWEHAIRIPESNHCLNLRSIFYWKDTKRSICERKLVR